ncbi:amino acid transporter [Nocardioides sp. Root614]|nr:amino acid transporter [Nocardioides sp. Root614]KRA91830.1 amino acid transporter [Nocardioides sp. Root682]
MNTENARLSELGYEAQLSRSLSLTDVVIYGLIYMVPIAPISVFGTVYNLSVGAAGAVYLVTALVMTFSALSYREMALQFPVAGSVYSYVRMGTSTFFGFISGWAILLDYLLLPALLCVFASLAMASEVTAVPGWAWVILFVAATAFINIMGVSVTARMNKIFLCIQLTVLTVFVVWATALIIAGDAYLSLDVLIPSSNSSWALVASAVPVAALSFIGFDAISTLNEEAEGGGATVARATIRVMWCVGVLFVLQVCLAAVLIPTGTTFADGDETNNAFYDIVSHSMAPWFGHVVLLTNALIALFANAIASNATSSRLVFSMARDGQLPRFLARVSDHKVPRNAMLFIAVLSIGIGVLGVEQSGLLITLVTFGALTAYILLNVAVVNHFIVRGKSRRFFLHLASPVIGTAILLFAMWSANPHAKILGVCWLAVGVGVAAFFKVTGRSMEQSDL